MFIVLEFVELISCHEFGKYNNLPKAQEETFVF